MTHVSGLFALDTLLTSGGLVADRDGDGLVDTVQARFALGPAADQPEYAAATNLAARLGLASLSCTPPLVAAGRLSPESVIPVFVGRPATVAVGCSPVLERALRDLVPGDGLVAALGGGGAGAARRRRRCARSGRCGVHRGDLRAVPAH